ncbi:prophage regulatory protein [Sulfitobacter undariae]|uniref:Prophage regulatory protein n=1 Tax=Sulfitobacter undariae TaxID=1563671 RepID=A0A7W6H1M2_9RHOB|nr:AlpA family transcriptional regulator [Sulfitobacter undariae]MBB3996046.1 prophage regulatory protein [Sulfitobacter undariae]
MVDKIRRLPQVVEYSGLSSSTIYEQIAEGTFPKPIRIGKRAVGWTESSLTAWVASKQVDAA